MGAIGNMATHPNLVTHNPQEAAMRNAFMPLSSLYLPAKGGSNATTRGRPELMALGANPRGYGQMGGVMPLGGAIGGYFR